MAEKNNCCLNRKVATESSIACIIPVFNEEMHLVLFLTELDKLIQPYFKNVQLIVVNDGSSDHSDSKIRELINTNQLNIHYLKFSRNFGKEYAITAGLLTAEQYDANTTLIIDADFQHPFDKVIEMIKLWEMGYDMVYGVQVNRHLNENIIKRGFKKIFYNLMGYVNINSRFQIPKNAGDFRLLDRKVVAAINKLTEKNKYMKGIYAWVGFNTLGIDFEPNNRQEGKSSFNYRRLFELALDGLTSFSTSPLRIATACGITISMASLIFGCYIIVDKFISNRPIPGFATLAASTLFLSGIQLFCIGLLGEYIGRIFVESKNRPDYIVDEEIISTQRYPKD